MITGRCVNRDRNADRNASANIAMNVILAAAGLLELTTWILGNN
jgi:hypothetical protein